MTSCIFHTQQNYLKANTKKDNKMSEDLIQLLRDFVEEKGRLPTLNEPELQQLIELAKKEFGS